MSTPIRRRTLLGCVLPCGCASDAPAPAPRSDALLTPWRRVPGGFLTPAVPGAGLPLRPGSGVFVKLVAPAALALRGGDLLVADLAASRVWRIDSMTQAMTGIAGAPVGPGTALLLGPDLSAWVLDPPARQVLRFARDGRLLQTFRSSPEAQPVAIALADEGSVVLQADSVSGRWLELRSVASLSVALRPERDGGQPIQVDAIAFGSRTPRRVFVLDRGAGLVHVVDRDGRVRATLGAGELRQPQALAVDRFDRVFVVESTQRTLRVLHAGAPSIELDARELGVQQIGGISIDDHWLAVSDRLVGQVVILRLGGGAP